MSNRSIPLALMLSILPVAGTAALSAVFADAESRWYLSLQKPIFNPPNWAFPVAWGIVYVCVMLSLYLLMRSGQQIPMKIPVLLCAAGALNVLWTAVFFKLHTLASALVLLCLLLIVLLFLFRKLYALHKASALLFLPHILWALFALVLNIAFVRLNGV